MKILDAITSALLAKKSSILSVCLGHQKLCEKLGMDVRAKEEPSQGVQRIVDFFRDEQKLAYYNTFSAFNDHPIEGVDVCSDPKTGEVHAVRGSHFSGFQFHPESIMSQNGFSILAEGLKRILQKKS